MNVEVVVATFGTAEWERQGHRAALKSGGRHVHLPDGTLAEARNQGAAGSKAEWLCFLDGDDELASGYFEAMEAALPRPSGRWLLCPAVAFVGRSGQRKNATIPRHSHLRSLRDGNWLVIGTLVQREVFEEVGGFREWPLYEDWDLWLRCWKAGARIVEVPDAHYIARVRPRSRNRGPSRVEKLRYHMEIAEANA